MKKVITGAILCAFVATPVMADFAVSNPAPYVNPGTTQVIYDPAYANVYTGVYRVYVSGSGALGLDGAWDSFCIDIWDSGGGNAYNLVGLAQAPDSPGGPMGDATAGKVAYLLDQYWNDTWLTTANLGNRNNNAAALQLAIWEVVAETSGTLSLTAGTFQASNTTVRGYAADLLESIGSNIGSIGSYRVFSSTGTQDYVVRVPVPGAVLLGMLGLGYAGIKLRRRRA